MTARSANAGFIVSTALLVLLCIGLVLAVFWHQRRLAERQLLRQQLVVRLERELPREIARLRERAAPAESKRRPELIEAQALINLHTRGRREMAALERERQRVKELVRNRIDARKELRRLSLEVRRAKMWVLLLEDRLGTTPGVRATGPDAAAFAWPSVRPETVAPGLAPTDYSNCFA